MTFTCGLLEEPAWRTASSVGRPATAMTRRYVAPSQRSIAFRDRRRSAQTVKSRRNGGTAWMIRTFGYAMISSSLRRLATPLLPKVLP